MTCTGINDYNRPLGSCRPFPVFIPAIVDSRLDIDTAAVGNSDQRIIGGPLEILGVKDHFVIICQHRRLAAADMFDVIVASFA
jgi:hypothetical protein